MASPTSPVKLCLPAAKALMLNNTLAEKMTPVIAWSHREPFFMLDSPRCFWRHARKRMIAANALILRYLIDD
jgi:hypothetical protein